MSAGQRRPIDCGLVAIGWLVLGAAGWSGPAAASARADIVELRGGGRVQGKVIPDPKAKDRVQVLLLQGRRPLSFHNSQILQVIPKASPLDDYVVKREKAAGSSQAQYELGYWCDQNRLTDLAKVHYDNALALIPTTNCAHQKLRHTKVDGSWLTRDDLSAAQGLVKYKGRWITAEEKANAARPRRRSRRSAGLVAAANPPAAAGARQRTADRRREAEAQLMAIRDPDAVVPLLRVFGREEAPRRILLALVLSTIGGPESTAALVQRVLDESDSEVRSITFEHLKQRDDVGIAGRFVRALGRDDITVINRAAWALGNLDAVESVPHLVTRLVTSEERIVFPSLDGSTPNVPGSPGLVPRAMNNFGVVYTSPPAATTGALAAGMGGIPYGAAPGLMPGGNYAGPAKPPDDAHVEVFTYRNVEVLSALQKLTGEDFGYDMEAWRRWVTRSFNPNPRPSRRVPQP